SLTAVSTKFVRLGSAWPDGFTLTNGSIGGILIRDNSASVAYVVDINTGQIVTRFDFQNDGNNSQSPGTSTVIEHKFASGYEYASLNMVYFRNRWYNLSTGRWCSEDPFGTVDFENLYSYCVNDPVRWADPYGTYMSTGLCSLIGRFEDGLRDWATLKPIRSYLQNVCNKYNDVPERSDFDVAILATLDITGNLSTCGAVDMIVDIEVEELEPFSGEFWSRSAAVGIDLGVWALLGAAGKCSSSGGRILRNAVRCGDRSVPAFRLAETSLVAEGEASAPAGYVSPAVKMAGKADGPKVNPLPYLREAPTSFTNFSNISDDLAILNLKPGKDGCFLIEESQIKELYNKWIAKATRCKPLLGFKRVGDEMATYKDGTTLFFRKTSKSGGPAIDIDYKGPDGKQTHIKIHVLKGKGSLSLCLHSSCLREQTIGCRWSMSRELSSQSEVLKSGTKSARNRFESFGKLSVAD
ncbi:MAG: RHS repeat-associated core domain-containing protein, partial [Candidatus Brocadiia bacterium]